MENLQAVTARIEQIREQLAVVSPPSAVFAETLAGAMARTGPPGADAAMAATNAAAKVPASLPGRVPSRVSGLSGLPPAATTRRSLSALGGQPAVGGQGLLRPVEGRITSTFGPRTHPIHGRQSVHAGVDFAAPPGTPIHAARGGTVAFAGVRGGYGNLVVLDHGDGMQTYYAHQRDLHVRSGASVAAGQAIGTVGSTGASTGPHLHFEVRRDGEPVDPLPLLGTTHSSSVFPGDRSMTAVTPNGTGERGAAGLERVHVSGPCPHCDSG